MMDLFEYIIKQHPEVEVFELIDDHTKCIR